MMEETARVIAVDNGQVTLESVIKSACSSCQQVDTCGSGQIAKAIPHKKLITTITTDKLLAVGDEVVLGISEKHILQTAWQVYIFPLIGLILFSALGQWLIIQQVISHEIMGIILGVLGGFVGFKLASYLQQRKSSQWLAPKILRVLPKNIVITQLSINKQDN